MLHVLLALLASQPENGDLWRRGPIFFAACAGPDSRVLAELCSVLRHRLIRVVSCKQNSRSCRVSPASSTEAGRWRDSYATTGRSQ